MHHKGFQDFEIKSKVSKTHEFLSTIYQPQYSIFST